jgi:hypothetical protein
MVSRVSARHVVEQRGYSDNLQICALAPGQALSQGQDPQDVIKVVGGVCPFIMLARFLDRDHLAILSTITSHGSLLYHTLPIPWIVGMIGSDPSPRPSHHHSGTLSYPTQRSFVDDLLARKLRVAL